MVFGNCGCGGVVSRQGALKLWRSGTLGYTDTIEDQFYDLGSTDYPELANVSAEDLPDLPSLLQRLRQGDVYRQVLVVDYDTDAVRPVQPASSSLGLCWAAWGCSQR